MMQHIYEICIKFNQNLKSRSGSRWIGRGTIAKGSGNDKEKNKLVMKEMLSHFENIC